MGGDVLATDSAFILQSVLRRNILSNASVISPSAIIQARELDWSVLSEFWSWTDRDSITNTTASAPSTPDEELLKPPFDIILTSDTVYSPDLVQPLLDTIHSLVQLSTTSTRPPPCFLCLERRDPQLVDMFLARAREMNFNISRVPYQKLKRALDRTGIDWSREDWDAVELWKLQLAKFRLSAIG
jgi:protein N-lysine methyltransferase METTL21D